MPPAARITDFHACPMVTPGTPPIPHVGGPIMKGSPNVLTGKLPQARVGDQAVCVGPMDVIVKGSTGVFVNKMAAARIGDQTAHGGSIVVGLPTVIIGETKGGGGGGAAGLPTGAVVLAYTEVIRQLQVLIDAWKSGAPFCEACFKKAMMDRLPTPKEQPLSFASIATDPPAKPLGVLKGDFRVAHTTPATTGSAGGGAGGGGGGAWGGNSQSGHDKVPVEREDVRKIDDARKRLVQAQNAVISKYPRSPDDTTYCNIAIFEVIRNLDGDTRGIAARNVPLLANDMALALENRETTPQFRPISREEAQKLADQGKVVLAAAYNPEIPNNGEVEHGHVALVRPSGIEGDPKIQPPIISNVGWTNGVKSEHEAFWSLTPTYYVLDR